MIEIYGRAFRRQEQPRPWWWTGLVVLGILIGLAWTIGAAYMGGNFLAWCIRNQHPQNQLAALRLVGLVFGVLALAASVKTWRQRLFLDAPIRDLASTPGSSWHVFRIAIRLTWPQVFSLQVLLTSVVLTPLFLDGFREVASAIAWASADDPGWIPWSDLLKYLQLPLAFVLSLISVLVLQAVFSVTAIALNLILAELGLGGAAPRWTRAERFLKYLLNFLSICGLAAFVATLIYWSSTNMPDPYPDWWTLGRWCHTVLDGQHALSGCLRAFPSVALAEVIHQLDTNPGAVRESWFHLLIWGVAAVGVAALFFRTGYSHASRSAFDGDGGSVRPADADPDRRRHRDHDGVHGPLERLLVKWLGRMGRAVLRLVSADVRSGALNHLILRALVVTLLCLVCGHLAMWAIPRGLDLVLRTYGFATLSTDDVGNVRTTVAIILLVGLSMYNLMHWAGPKIWMAGTKALARDEQADRSAMPWGILFKKPKTATRGDRRYPLLEIYAVGFSDAVWVPTLYAGVGLLVAGTAIGATGLLLGLDPPSMGWTLALGIPILWQGAFLSYIFGISSYWMHYSRSLLIQVFNALWTGVLMAVGLIGTVALIIVLCRLSFAAEYPAWIPWLGSLNILLMADVAFYMTVRWLYVRRRFDAEYRNPAAWG